jgi:hypothetical protein
MERALWCAINLGSCAEQLDSEYSVDFIREVDHLCAIELKLCDILGPTFFEASPQNKEAWNRILGV